MAHLPTQVIPYNPEPQKPPHVVDRDRVKAFLNELTALTHKYKIEIILQQIGFDAYLSLEDKTALSPSARYIVDSGWDNLELIDSPDNGYHKGAIEADSPTPN